MKVRIRIIPDDRALNLHMSVRLPYDDLKVAWAVLARTLGDHLKRVG